MATDTLRRIILFIVLCLVQGLVLNHINLFGYATPLLYVYMALTFPRGYPRWAILLWCFFLGLSVDTFTNTPGVAAASMTLVGLLQPFVLELFMQRDSEENFKPTLMNLGYVSYIYYMLLLLSIYCIAYYSIEMFTFFNWLQWVECVVGSLIITSVLVFVIEHMRR
ncbi:MAG: rod shape-determining protein MreD [Prevotella sp.]|nr:rod shape-determining protein MreD [Prevotella sp.]